MHLIGVDIGGTSIKGGRLTSTGTVVETIRRPTEGRDIGSLVDSLSSLIGALAQGHRVTAIGIGIPGLRSADTGVIEASPNLPALDGVNLETILGARVGSRIVGRNDADMSAWGEFSVGAGVGARNLICLTLGTGVGSGLILGGEPYTGSCGYAAEAGHMVVDIEGMPCACGSRGCLETVASATGIVALARRRMRIDPDAFGSLPEPLTAEALYRAAQSGSGLGRAIFAEAGRYLGVALASLINILNPDTIVIAGGVAGAGDLLLEPALSEARSRAHRPAFEATRIVPAALGADAGIVGAALFAGR